MITTERCERVVVNLSNSFSLRMNLGQIERGLSIEEPKNFGQNSPQDSQDLLRTVLLSHLISPHLPRIIETNFPVDYTQFLSELYQHYGCKPPKIKKNKDQVSPTYLPQTNETLPQILNANAHSGGLDSVYRLLQLLKQGESVLAVHLRNLNSKANHAEAIASQRQCQTLNLPYEQVRLKNSSGNTNFETVRTRDLLLALIVAIKAAPYQVNKVLIEGCMGNDPQNTHFSEYLGAWNMFNKLLKDVNLNLVVEGVDQGDIETVGQVLKLEKELSLEILSQVQNCFSSPFQIGNNRGKWERRTPFLAKQSPNHWCGSCLKCRRMTLGRIYYQDKKLEKLPKEEYLFFLKDTLDWMRKYPHNRDLISESFISHLTALSR